MKKVLAILFAVFIAASCSDDEKQPQEPKLAGRWYLESSRINGITTFIVPNVCGRDYLEITESFFQSTSFEIDEALGCQTISSISGYILNGSIVTLLSSGVPTYEFESNDNGKLVLHLLIPTDVDGDGTPDEINYTYTQS